MAGDTRMVLVTGDAGVGKTRFIGEGMARAAATGVVVLRGQCLPLASELPLLPVAAALGQLADLDEGRVLDAALRAAPGFVPGEVARLVPALGEGGGTERDGAWSRKRLLSAVAELLDAVAKQSSAAVALVVEDVHWVDSATMDCLTFLSRPGRRSRVKVLVTCRSDEAPLAAAVAGWLAQLRGDAGVEEIVLGPLTRAEVAEHAAALAGRELPSAVVDELYGRAEGNPFFTEQLVAAAPPAGQEGEEGAAPVVPVGLPARLSELLVARANRCAGDARAVLNAMAIAGRPLEEDLLCEITGMEPTRVRQGLRELAAARLLADDAAHSNAHQPRHALLAEAVAARLLPGERATLHESAARALAGNQALAAEAAAHWQAAGRPADELPTRVVAAKGAELVFGYAEAAAHWQRAVELSRALPDATRAAGMELPGLYLRGIDALYLAGDSGRAGLLAEEAYRRFAADSDRATAAVVRYRAAYYRAVAAPADGLPLMEEALRLFEPSGPSAEHAQAWFDYSNMQFAAGSEDGRTPALNRALEIAEAANATVLIPAILAVIASEALARGEVEEWSAVIQRARSLAEASEGGAALVWLAVNESDALQKQAKFTSAADVALRAIEAARRAGLEAWYASTILTGNACEALLAQGATAQAAALVDPLTTGLPDRDHWVLYEVRAEIDLLRGDVDAAAERHQRVRGIIGPTGDMHFARETACLGAQISLWAARPRDALDEVQRALPLFKTPDLTILCGRLLAIGMHACADLAERARARHDSSAAEDAAAAADGLASWVEQMGGAPFTDHPSIAAIPADRATWEAEQTRLAGHSDAALWLGAAKAWQDLGCPHRAGYAWWRQAQAQLDAGQPAAAAADALRAAATAADGHEPLLAQIRLLAERARIPLQAQTGTHDAAAPPAEALPSLGLTSREQAVLRLVAAGKTNTQIGAELYISQRTAGVHVTNILRKLGVSNRVQAAALAERAGLLQQSPPPHV
jgi:ATP/maltotriose-dependent transcriptional regulator MalT